MYTLCRIPENKSNCAGCCLGNIYASRDEILAGLGENTHNYREFMRENPTGSQKDAFFNRKPENVENDSGVCSFLVYLDDSLSKVGCAGHPIIHGTDFRQKFNICYSGYLCVNAKKFSELSKLEQEKIASNLDKKYGPDWLTLSMDMEKNDLF